MRRGILALVEFSRCKRLFGASRAVAAVAVCALLCSAGRTPVQAANHAAVVEPPPTACERATFRVVIDVGHTLDVPGAISARGIPEYAFNLQLGKDVRQALLNAGFSKTVLLITTTKPWAGLFERAARANAMAADLFIAIHHDSVPDFLIETWQYAGKENHFSDRFKGYALFVSNDNPQHAASLRFGSLLGEELQARGLHYTPHYTLPLMQRFRHQLLDAKAGVYRYDQLIVLRNTRMPALLIEAGSIVNRAEELELAGAKRRGRTSAAIAAAVEEFCAERVPASADKMVRRALPGKTTAQHGIFGSGLFTR
jgi:N-acetylmuramoyl-L-alanine amidase